MGPWMSVNCRSLTCEGIEMSASRFRGEVHSRNIIEDKFKDHPSLEWKNGRGT